MDISKIEANRMELYEEAICAWEACPSPDPVDRTTQFYIELYLQNGILAKVDRASMLHSLEVRCPYLDIDVVDFARRLPARCRLRGRTTKFLLKQALRGVLPDETIDRPKKGFGVPLETWFMDWPFRKEDLGGTLSRPFMTAQLERHRSRRHNAKQFLWNLTVLEHAENRRRGEA